MNDDAPNPALWIAVLILGIPLIVLFVLACLLIAP
jgi:hypothetical protein